MEEKITARLAGVANIPQEFMSETPPPPKSVKIEISSRCNYKCAYCALSTRSNIGPADIDFDFFQRITKEIVGLGIQEIGVFYIGESFTNPDLLVRCIRWLKKDLNAKYVFLTTNGSLAYSKHVRACMDAGLDSLKFSVNFADEGQFKEMSGATNASLFTQAHMNIELAYMIREAVGYDTRLYSSSIMYNRKQEERMAHLLESKILPYVDEHYWLPLFNETAAFPGRAQSIIGNVGNYHSPVDPLPCWSVFTAAHIMVDGKMSACCHDAIGNWVMGDLTKQSFMDAWHSNEYKELRRAHLLKDVAGTKCVGCIDSTTQIGH